MQNQKRKSPKNNTTYKTPTPISSTSWGKVAEWYDEYLQDEDTYQAKVISPNLMRILRIEEQAVGTKILELGCGQGYFVEQVLSHAKQTVNVEGVDVGKELLDIAKNKNQKAVFTHTPASNLGHIQDHSVDIVYSVLALQNMDNFEDVIREVKRVLKPHGRFVAVLNHPTFRIPKQSDWYFSNDRKAQGRVVYTYMSSQKIGIDMHPGQTVLGAKKQETFSFHHPLQFYTKVFAKYNLGISRIEEWISHKTSEEGPKKRAEDSARKEIPLFMCLEIRSFIA